HRLGRLVGEMAVFGRGLVTDLPGTIHLIAEAPELHAPWLAPTVAGPQVTPVGAAGMVAVFEEAARRIEAARAEIDRKHHLGPGGRAPVGEFVDADLVRFARAPGEIEPHRTALLRSDAILPIIGGDEIAPGIAHDRDAQLADTLEHVAAEAPGVGARVPGLVDPGVDSSAEMLEEGAVETVVDSGDRKIPVRRHRRLHHRSPPVFCGFRAIYPFYRR